MGILRRPKMPAQPPPPPAPPSVLDMALQQRNRLETERATAKARKSSSFLTGALGEQPSTTVKQILGGR